MVNVDYEGVNIVIQGRLDEQRRSRCSDISIFGGHKSLCRVWRQNLGAGIGF